MIDDMLQNMLINTNDAISLEFLENDRLLVHLIRGIAWSFTSTPVTVGQGMVDPSERLPKAVALQACVCVCRPCHKKKLLSLEAQAAYTRDQEGSRGITSVWGSQAVVHLFRSVMRRVGQKVHWPQAHPMLRCGVVSKEIKATRKTYLAEGVSQVILIFFQLRWEISTVVDPCVRTQTGHP